MCIIIQKERMPMTPMKNAKKNQFQGWEKRLQQNQSKLMNCERETKEVDYEVR